MEILQKFVAFSEYMNFNEMDSWCPELEEFQNEIIDFGPQWYIGKSLGRDKEMEKWNKIFKIAFFLLLTPQMSNMKSFTLYEFREWFQAFSNFSCRF